LKSDQQPALSNAWHHLVCAWGALVFVPLFGVGWALLAGYVPPPSPLASAVQIAQFYQAHQMMILLGMVIIMLGIAPLMPFFSAVSVQMARIEGRWPVLAVAQAMVGLANTLLLLLPVIMWVTAAFRPERDAELIRLLNDIGWMIMLWPFSLASLQNVLIGVCVLSDKREEPVFPRWVAFLNLWVALLLFPGGLLPFFKTGPFAWNGLLAFWLVACVYLSWLVIMSVVLIGAIRRQTQSDVVSLSAMKS
jgi:hypothetical protein